MNLGPPDYESFLGIFQEISNNVKLLKINRLNMLCIAKNFVNLQLISDKKVTESIN